MILLLVKFFSLLQSYKIYHKIEYPDLIEFPIFLYRFANYLIYNTLAS